MISFRQLLIIALVIAGIWLLGRLRQQFMRGRKNRARQNIAFQKTIRCQRCGLYLPDKAATGATEEIDCTDDHCPIRNKIFE